MIGLAMRQLVLATRDVFFHNLFFMTAAHMFPFVPSPRLQTPGDSGHDSCGKS